MGTLTYGRSEVQGQRDASYSGSGDPSSFPQSPQHLEPHTSGNRKSRGPQGSEGLQAVSQVADLYEHPQVDDDLERMPAKNVDNYHARVAELRSGQRHSSTHPLNGPLKGWQGTSLGGTQYRMIHRFSKGALEVVAAGNHEPAYDSAQRRMRSLGMGQAGPDYDNLSFRHGEHELYPSEGMDYNTIFAHHPEHGDVGRLTYREMDHPAWTGMPERALHVTMMHVEPEHRRRGVANQLMQHLEETHPDVPIDHGHRRPDGEEWAKTHYNDPNGGDLVGGEFRGAKSEWTLNGKPWNVNTKKHYRMPKPTSSLQGNTRGKIVGSRFTPNQRVFTHTDGLDHRLWDADEKLRPEVRSYILNTINVMWADKYKNWANWAKIYFAGSEASEWTSEELTGNGDLDVLVGVDYDKFRVDNPKYEGQSNQEITDEMNHGFRPYNGEVYLSVDGTKYGPFDRTTYVNPDSYDIRKIKPYAAYDVGNDVWVVRPPHLPHWSLSELPRAIQQVLRAADSYAKHVLRLPEPERTQQGASLFDAWHTDRSRAFSDRGEGWWDIANLREKWLDQEGVWAEIVNCKHRATEGLDLAPTDWSNTPTGYTAAIADHFRNGGGYDAPIPVRTSSLVDEVRSHLSDDLLKPEYRNREDRKTTSGHCYAASEALYHMMGGKDAGITPMQVHHEGDSHWFLKGAQGEVIDPTHDQFETPVPYDQAKGKGFLTREPSRRAQMIIDRVNQKKAAVGDRHYGKGLDSLFPDSAPITNTPFPQAGQRKDRHAWDQDLVARSITHPHEFPMEEVDTRGLRATQPQVVRAGVKHYMENGTDVNPDAKTYGEENGGDRRMGNDVPRIYHRDDGQRIILTGHHRATAQHLKGEPLKAMIISGGWGGPRGVAKEEALLNPFNREDKFRARDVVPLNQQKPQSELSTHLPGGGLVLHPSDESLGKVRFEARPPGQGCLITHMGHDNVERQTVVPDEAMGELYRWMKKQK